jgi:carbon-monoxide dehydrogenase medium subunit
MDQYGEKAAVLAGGTDLLVNMKHKKVAPGHLVSLEGIEDLAGITATAESLNLGPLLSAASLASSPELKGAGAVLALAAGSVGSPQIRNLASVGGNVCTARPAADMCVGLLALGGRAILAGPSGERSLDLAEFFQGPGQTAKKDGEILVGLAFDAPAEGSGGGYQKLGLRKALEIALVNVGAILTLASDGKTVSQARVSLGAVAPTPIISPGAAKVLEGAKAGDKVFAEAAKAAAADAKPIDDHRGSADYRRQMVEVLTRRALKQAHQAASGQ